MKTVGHFNGRDGEHRLLLKNPDIPLLEIFAEKPKTLGELQAQIQAISDQSRTSEEWDRSLRDVEPGRLDVISANLEQLQSRKDLLAPVLARLDMRGLMERVSTLKSTGETGEVAPAESSTIMSTLEKVKDDFVQGDALTKTSYVVGAGVGFLGARWLWRKVFGDQENEGFLKKTGKWMLSILAAVGGAIGIANIKQWWNRTAASPWSMFASSLQSAFPFLKPAPIDPTAPGAAPAPSILGLPAATVNAGRDITQGGLKSLDELILDPARGVAEVVSPLLDGDVGTALEVAARNSWHIFVNEQGEIVVLDTLFKPLTAPIKATLNLLTEKGRSSEDFWVVWGEAGGAYLIAKKAAEAWRTGKLPIPMTMKAVVADALRVASGPVQFWVDGARTLILATQKDGMAALRLRYSKLSAIGRLRLRSGNSIFALAIRNEESALRLLSQYKRLTEEIRIMRNFKDPSGFVSFSEAEIESMEKLINNGVDSVKKYLQTADSLESPFLRALKEKVSHITELDEFRKELAKVFNEFAGNPRGVLPTAATADESLSLIDEALDASRGAEASDALPVLDDALDATRAAETSDILPFVDDAARAPAAMTEEGTRLARAVGDGVVEPAPRLATDAVEEVAEAAPGLRVVRETGEVVDPSTGRVIEEVAESAAPAAEAVRATEVAEEAREVRRAVELLDASIREYKPVQQLLTGARGSQYAEVLAEAHRLHQAAGAKRVARYLLTMTDDLDDTRRAAMVAPEVIQLIAEGKHGNPVAIARTLSIIKLQPGAALDAAKCIRQMSAWRSSGTLGRSMQALGIAADVVMLGVDIYSLVESYNNREEHRSILVKGLTDAGLTSTDGEKFSGFGIEVNISQMQEADVERYSTLVAADAAALGAGVAVTFMSLGASAGPVGLAVAGVAIAVNYSVNQIFTAFDQREREQFLSRAPQWLLAMLRTETLLQKSEHSLIREFNGVMTQDIWPADWKELILGKSIASLTEMRDPAQRERIRTKLLQSLCYQAILTRYPDLAAEIPGIANPREFFQENGQFLKEGGDFERIVKPYITLRLHAMTKGESVSFGSTNILDLSDNRGSEISAWWNDIPTINEHDLTRATEEGMLFYVHHLREVEFRDNLRDIDTAVEEERARLSSAGVTDPELTERVTLFRESHETALRDEMEAMKSRFFVFNQNPFALSSSRTGPTLAEQILADKSEEARMGSDERSAELVSRKWGIPGATQNGDIEWFAREYVQPQFRDRAREYLVQRSPEAGKPFSFDELNEMGETKEQFATAFIEKMAPVRSVLAELTDGISTQEGLKKFLERNQSKIEFMTSVYDHEEYYRSYLTDWRGIGSGLIPENRMSFIKKIAEWKERGYPTLLDEDKFRQIQEFARNRPAPSAPGVVGPVPGLPVFSERPRARIEQSLPGYDPLSRDKLYSLESYVALVRRLSVAAAASRIPENPLDLLMGAGAPPGRIRMPSGGARELLLRGVTPEDKPLDPATAINARFIAQLSELEKYGLLRHTLSAPDRTVTPRSSGDAVAVTPQELTMLMTILGGQPVAGAERFFGAPGSGDRPVTFPTELLNGSDFSLLQIYLLQSRVYVTDRAPEAAR